MNAEIEGNRTAAMMAVGFVPGDGSLAWYKVVGIEFVLFAGIVVPLICGAFLAR